MRLEDYKKRLIAEGYSQRTVQIYTILVGQYLNIYNRPDKASIIDFLSQLSENGSSHQKLRMYYYALARYYYYSTGSKLDVKPPRSMPAPVQALTNEEARRLIKAASENEKYQTIIEFLLKTGLRVSELLNLKPEDIDLKAGTVYVKYGKRGKHRVIPADAGILKRMVKHLPLGITARRIEQAIRTYAKRARITKKRVSPHVLRHTYATILLRNGVNLEYIRRLLGHSSIKTTMVYLDVTDEDLKKVYKEHFRL